MSKGKESVNFNSYKIGVIFIASGVFLKLPGHIGQMDWVFQIGLACSAIGIIFVIFAIIPKKKNYS